MLNMGIFLANCLIFSKMIMHYESFIEFVLDGKISYRLLYRVYYFTFEHQPDYQKVQFQFLDAVDTYDPNAIAVSKFRDVSLKFNII